MSDSDSSWTNLRLHWEKSAREERPEREAAAHPNMKEISRLTCEMINDGWRNIRDCPKDGSMFWAWEPNMSMPYKCKYEGKWSNGKWWAYVDGDIWPCNPSLFKSERNDRNADKTRNESALSKRLEKTNRKRKTL